MTRQIIHTDCITNLRAKFPEGVIDQVTGESVKYVDGISGVNCYCDTCGQPIAEGDKVVAFSIWTNHAPYYGWEYGYLKNPAEVESWNNKVKK